MKAENNAGGLVVAYTHKAIVQLVFTGIVALGVR